MFQKRTISFIEVFGDVVEREEIDRRFLLGVEGREARSWRVKPEVGEHLNEQNYSSD